MPSTITGRLVSATGAVKPAVPFLLLAGQGSAIRELATVTTDNSGLFVLSLLPGHYALRFATTGDFFSFHVPLNDTAYLISDLIK